MITNLHEEDQLHAADFSSQTISANKRIFSLDVLRGIAVLAALLVSIWMFGGFGPEQQKEVLMRTGGWGQRAFAAVEIFLNGKMRALIAIVFGAAMVVFLSKERQPGKEPADDVFIKRQLWLILLGIINAVVFLWTQDILFHLGIMGILLFPFVKLSHRALLIAAVLTTFIYSAKNYWNYADDKGMYKKYLAVSVLEKRFDKDSIAKVQKGIVVKKDTLSKEQKRDKSNWEGRLGNMKVDLKKDSANMKTMHSESYGKTWDKLVPIVQTREAQWLYRIGIWDFAGMIFLGMFLYKLEFFNNNFSRNKYLLLGLCGILIGVGFAWYRLHFQQIAIRDYEKYINRYALPYTFLFPLERAAMALGYASIVLAFLSAGFLQIIWKSIADVGKMALTNYFIQTIVCTIFFYGYGMGYFARLTQGQLYFFAAMVIVVQIAISVTWLKNYNYGPVEWLLRRLSNKRKPGTDMSVTSASETIMRSI